jgi:hypothetical protein
LGAIGLPAYRVIPVQVQPVKVVFSQKPYGRADETAIKVEYYFDSAYHVAPTLTFSSKHHC